MFLDYLHILVPFLLFRVQLFHSFLHNSCWQTQVYQVYNASIFSPYLCKYCIICLSLCCLFLVLSVTIVINIFFLTILVGNTFAGHGKCIFPGRLETLSAQSPSCFSLFSGSKLYFFIKKIENCLLCLSVFSFSWCSKNLTNKTKEVVNTTQSSNAGDNLRFRTFRSMKISAINNILHNYFAAFTILLLFLL